MSLDASSAVSWVNHHIGERTANEWSQSTEELYDLSRAWSLASSEEFSDRLRWIQKQIKSGKLQLSDTKDLSRDVGVASSIAGSLLSLSVSHLRPALCCLLALRDGSGKSLSSLLEGSSSSSDTMRWEGKEKENSKAVQGKCPFPFLPPVPFSSFLPAKTGAAVDAEVSRRSGPAGALPAAAALALPPRRAARGLLLLEALERRLCPQRGVPWDTLNCAASPLKSVQGVGKRLKTLSSTPDSEEAAGPFNHMDRALILRLLVACLLPNRLARASSSASLGSSMEGAAAVVVGGFGFGGSVRRQVTGVAFNEERQTPENPRGTAGAQEPSASSSGRNPPPSGGSRESGVLSTTGMKCRKSVSGVVRFATAAPRVGMSARREELSKGGGRGEGGAGDGDDRRRKGEKMETETEVLEGEELLASVIFVISLCDALKTSIRQRGGEATKCNDARKREGEGGDPKASNSILGGALASDPPLFNRNAGHACQSTESLVSRVLLENARDAQSFTDGTRLKKEAKEHLRLQYTRCWADNVRWRLSSPLGLQDGTICSRLVDILLRGCGEGSGGTHQMLCERVRQPATDSMRRRFNHSLVEGALKEWAARRDKKKGKGNEQQCFFSDFVVSMVSGLDGRKGSQGDEKALLKTTSAILGAFALVPRLSVPLLESSIASMLRIYLEAKRQAAVEAEGAQLSLTTPLFLGGTGGGGGAALAEFSQPLTKTHEGPRTFRHLLRERRADLLREAEDMTQKENSDSVPSAYPLELCRRSRPSLVDPFKVRLCMGMRSETLPCEEAHLLLRWLNLTSLLYPTHSLFHTSSRPTNNKRSPGSHKSPAAVGPRGRMRRFLWSIPGRRRRAERKIQRETVETTLSFPVVPDFSEAQLGRTLVAFRNILGLMARGPLESETTTLSTGSPPGPSGGMTEGTERASPPACRTPVKAGPVSKLGGRVTPDGVSQVQISKRQKVRLFTEAPTFSKGKLTALAEQIDALAAPLGLPVAFFGLSVKGREESSTGTRGPSSHLPSSSASSSGQQNSQHKAAEYLPASSKTSDASAGCLGSGAGTLFAFSALVHGAFHGSGEGAAVRVRAAVVVQRHFRRFLRCRRHWTPAAPVHTRLAVISIQSAVRAHLASEVLKRQRHAAVLIQRAWRGATAVTARKESELVEAWGRERETAAAFVQRFVRRVLATHLERQQRCFALAAVSRIQTAWRNHSACADLFAWRQRGVHAAVLIQRAWRRHFACRDLVECRLAAVYGASLIQRAWRRCFACRDLIEHRHVAVSAAVLIQRAWRRHCACRDLVECRLAAVYGASLIQRAWRRHKACRDLIERRHVAVSAAALLQRAWRRSCACRDLVECRLAAVYGASLIQRAWRRHEACRDLVACRHTAVSSASLIQKAWRRHEACRDLVACRHTAASSASLIQKAWRRHEACRDLVACRHTAVSSASLIQRAWRRYEACRDLVACRHTAVSSASLIQKAWRRYEACRDLVACRHTAVSSALLIQKAWRRHEACRDLVACRHTAVSSASLIQKAWRRHEACRDLVACRHTAVSSASLIQKAWRRHEACRDLVACRHTAVSSASLIQKAWRRHEACRDLVACRHTAVSSASLIQKAWRRYEACRDLVACRHTAVSSASLIQKAWRRHEACRDLVACRHTAVSSASLIQKAWRRRLACAELVGWRQRTVWMASRIQASWRRRFACRSFVAFRLVALSFACRLQRFWRNRSTCRPFIAVRVEAVSAIRRVQLCWRRHASCRNAVLARNLVVGAIRRVQRFWKRRSSCRPHVTFRYRAVSGVVCIQSCWRRHRVCQDFVAVRHEVVSQVRRLQRCWRSRVVCRELSAYRQEALRGCRRVQSWWRKYLACREVIALRHEVVGSVRRLQKFWRRRAGCREEVNGRRRAVHAARRVQRWIRTLWACSAAVAWRRVEVAKRREALRRLEAIPGGFQAALRIQTWTRQVQAERLRKRRWRALLLIQRVVRGHITRGVVSRVWFEYWGMDEVGSRRGELRSRGLLKLKPEEGIGCRVDSALSAVRGDEDRLDTLFAACRTLDVAAAFSRSCATLVAGRVEVLQSLLTVMDSLARGPTDNLMRRVTLSCFVNSLSHADRGVQTAAVRTLGEALIRGAVRAVSKTSSLSSETSHVPPLALCLCRLVLQIDRRAAEEAHAEREAAGGGAGARVRASSQGRSGSVRGCVPPGTPPRGTISGSSLRQRSGAKKRGSRGGGNADPSVGGGGEDKENAGQQRPKGTDGVNAEEEGVTPKRRFGRAKGGMEGGVNLRGGREKGNRPEVRGGRSLRGPPTDLAVRVQPLIRSLLSKIEKEDPQLAKLQHLVYPSRFLSLPSSSWRPSEDELRLSIESLVPFLSSTVASRPGTGQASQAGAGRRGREREGERLVRLRMRLRQIDRQTAEKFQLLCLNAGLPLDLPQIPQQAGGSSQGGTNVLSSGVGRPLHGGNMRDREPRTVFRTPLVAPVQMTMKPSKPVKSPGSDGRPAGVSPCGFVLSEEAEGELEVEKENQGGRERDLEPGEEGENENEKKCAVGPCQSLAKRGGGAVAAASQIPLSLAFLVSAVTQRNAAVTPGASKPVGLQSKFAARGGQSAAGKGTATTTGTGKDLRLAGELRQLVGL
uniref:Calponin-homology (CH) domain-containing protein n=1 Tax=Chromera velia CCMP2878 TaxID=1169474 RepID=A0A0G4I155_9ALVE|eukprot:Cvel_1643.t1-p1 / transcript=Cvel_1643.t1 / gene=Cvel_1643 / organism=Chromera_velia_CCMP2878 / gene_product=Histidine-rich protein PFHRP-II, putative / transcript_product=Histidine-rich protein PFHRP-II, putative / location=Cvel_scaffold59:51219-63689(-) / protein_length=2616 / sequence_SO=supercontig / SO=protein_coding / is_pseudo=false